MPTTPKAAPSPGLPPSPQPPVVTMTDLRFAWEKASRPLLQISRFTIHQGERLFLIGPSGSGKSSLLALLAGVATPQQGSITVLDTELTAMASSARDRFRADHLGVIFQMFNLIPSLSMKENVTLPCRFSPLRARRAASLSGSCEKEAARLLERLELTEELATQPVSQLSVGQQQRVAAARALIGSPELIIADEPTSSLDSERREAFLRLLFTESRAAGSTLLFVSHDTTLAPLFDRTVSLAEINRKEGV